MARRSCRAAGGAWSILDLRSRTGTSLGLLTCEAGLGIASSRSAPGRVAEAQPGRLTPRGAARRQRRRISRGNGPSADRTRTARRAHAKRAGATMLCTSCSLSQAEHHQRPHAHAEATRHHDVVVLRPGQGPAGPQCAGWRGAAATSLALELRVNYMPAKCGRVAGVATREGGQAGGHVGGLARALRPRRLACLSCRA